MPANTARFLSELLERIFQQVLDATPNIAARPHPRQIKPELRSAILVCKPWKEVLQASSKCFLITCMFDSDLAENGRFLPTQEQYVLWLSDSRNCDIDIRLRGPNHRSWGVFEQVPLKYIGSFSHQWRIFVAKNDNSTSVSLYSPIMRQLSSNGTRRLLQLEIDCAYVEPQHDLSYQMSSLPKCTTDFDAPCLNILKLMFADFTKSWPSGKVLERIEKFYYSLNANSVFPTPATLSRLLRPAVQLGHLSVRFEVVAETSHTVDAWYAGDLVRLPGLHSLGLSLDSNYMAALLTLLEIENLHSLWLDMNATKQISTELGQDLHFPNLTIPLHRLEYLCIKATDSLCATRFLALLETPTLHELEIILLRENMSLESVQLPFPMLEKLSIRARTIGMRQILEHLEMPSLKRLLITMVKDIRDRSRLGGPEEPVALPNLEIYEMGMAFLNYGRYDMDEAEIVEWMKNENSNAVPTNDNAPIGDEGNNENAAGDNEENANDEDDQEEPLVNNEAEDEEIAIEGPAEQDTTPIFSRYCDLAAVFRLLPKDRLHSLVIRNRAEAWYQLVFENKQGTRKLRTLSLSVSSEGGWGAACEGLKMADLRNLQVLRLDIDIPADKVYSRAFGQFNFRALWSSPETDADDAITTKPWIPFPNLETLQVIFPRIRSDTIFMQALRELVVMRKTLGVPLRRLEIYPPASKYYCGWLTKHIDDYAEFRDPCYLPPSESYIENKADIQISDDEGDDL